MTELIDTTDPDYESELLGMSDFEREQRREAAREHNLKCYHELLLRNIQPRKTSSGNYNFDVPSMWAFINDCADRDEFLIILSDILKSGYTVTDKYCLFEKLYNYLDGQRTKYIEGLIDE